MIDITNKPTWDNAPKWANFLAMDYDGEWYWHLEEPIYSDDVWISIDILDEHFIESFAGFSRNDESVLKEYSPKSLEHK